MLKINRPLSVFYRYIVQICQLGVFLSICRLILLLFPMLLAAQEILIPEGNPQVAMEGMLLGARGIAVDLDGNLYVADTQNHVVRKYLPNGTPLLVFGRESVAGQEDGSPVDVRFNLPFRLAIAPNGDIIVADNSSLIRRINTKTLITTTVADISYVVDGSQMLNVITGQMVNEGMLDNLRIGDIAVRPNGDIFVRVFEVCTPHIKRPTSICELTGLS